MAGTGSDSDDRRAPDRTSDPAGVREIIQGRAAHTPVAPMAELGVVLVLLLTLGLEFTTAEFADSVRRHVSSAGLDLVLNATPGALAHRGAEQLMLGVLGTTLVVADDVTTPGEVTCRRCGCRVLSAGSGGPRPCRCPARRTGRRRFLR